MPHAPNYKNLTRRDRRLILAPWVAASQVSTLGGADEIEFLTQCEFSTADAAPITNPYVCEVDSLKVLDTNNYAGVSGGKYATTDVTGNNDPAFWATTAQTRAAGLAVACKIDYDNKFYMGLSVNNTGRVLRNSFLFTSTTLGFYDTAALTDLTAFDAAVVGDEYELVVVANSAGCHYLIKGSTKYPVWTRLFLGKSETTATLYPGWTSAVGGNDLHSIDYFRAFQLPAPWTTDTGTAVSVLAGNRSAGDTFTHGADGFIRLDVDTLPSGDQIEIRFRIQDAQNYWQVTIDSSGTIDLDEVASGSPTQRATSASALVNGDLMMIGWENTGDTFAVWSLNGTTWTREISYTSGGAYEGEVNGELETLGTGGAVSDIETYTRTLAGAELSTIEARTNF